MPDPTRDALCPSGEEGHSGSDRSSKANVEQIFSRAGGLTDPNIDQDYLATLVVVGCKRRHSSRAVIKAVMPLRPSTSSSFVAREGRDSRRTKKRQTKPAGGAPES